MPSSFIWFACSWFSWLSNPSYLVPVIREVQSSGSVKRLSLVCLFTLHVFLVVSSFILVWDIVGEYRLENMIVGSNNCWFNLVISHLSLLSYPQCISCSVKYSAPSGWSSSLVVNDSGWMV